MGYLGHKQAKSTRQGVWMCRVEPRTLAISILSIGYKSWKKVRKVLRKDGKGVREGWKKGMSGSILKRFCMLKFFLALQIKKLLKMNEWFKTKNLSWIFDVNVWCKGKKDSSLHSSEQTQKVSRLQAPC